MNQRIAIRVPDIGDFEHVPVIEILVSPGDEVEADQSLITLESDKATMDVPAPAAGRLVEFQVSEGDKVSEGDLIAVMEIEHADERLAEGQQASEQESRPSSSPESRSGKRVSSDSGAESENSVFDLVVLGAGPGGYTAAFRAADLGLKVALVERYPDLGGVCLNVGCIPSKALLHVGQVIDEAAHLGDHGVVFGAPRIDLDRLRDFKNKVVGKLTGGLAGMASKRGVSVIQGTGAFQDSHTLMVGRGSQRQSIRFRSCIIAAGSRVIEIPNVPWGDARVMDSTGALALADIPKRLLVIGGGIIGLEMACVYRALGSQVTVVEMMPQLMPGADADLVRPLQQRMKAMGVRFLLKTRVAAVEAEDDRLLASLEGSGSSEPEGFDRVLVSVGRRPNGDLVGAGAAGINVDDRGFIPVNGQMQTNLPHIFAIGDIVGQPMLAHKASYEGKVAAEVVAGHRRAADARVIPSVAYTDPEVAWVGLTEAEAKEQGLDYGVGKFPWAASGRALGMDRAEGLTKLIFDKDTDRLIGAGVVGMHAGDLIGELALSIEMGCQASDIGLTIHPHPTLSESVMMAAEVYEGTITDLYLGR